MKPIGSVCVVLAFGVSTRTTSEMVAFTGRAVLHTIKIGQKSRASLRAGRWLGACQRAKEKVVPGIELGLPESESDVLTITLYNQLLKDFRFNTNMILHA
jgi:hypothetical protein